MTPGGIEWMVLVLWLGLTTLGLWKRNLLFSGSSAILGLFFGIMLITEASWLGFIMVLINIGMLFNAFFGKK